MSEKEENKTENLNEKTAADLAGSITQDIKELAGKSVDEAKAKIKNIDTEQIKSQVASSASNVKAIDWSQMIIPLENKLLAGLIVSFFLPWVSLGPISASGVSIPGAIQDLANLANAFNQNAETPFTLHYYLLFLIPLGSMAGAWFRYNGDMAKAKLFSLVAAGVFMVFFIGALIEVGADVFNALSYGGLASLVLSISIIVITLNLHTKFKKA